MTSTAGARITGLRYLLTACLAIAGIGLGWAIWAAEPPSPQQAQWFKGNIHCHTLWSDGDDFPEMVADWYRSHGYHFLAISDHNVLMQGQRWEDLRTEKRTIPPEVLDKCRKRFGDSWVQTRSEAGKQQVRLKTLAEVRQRLEEPGKFLLIENEEITGKWQNHEVHLNALNVGAVILPKQG